ncbi:MAG: protein translocase subunit SecD [Gammaproteobacteria bacterium]|nr:protein translocase subunit SecD [Gammaproteobacteria bacterium]
MTNQYPLWKNLLILCVVIVGALYALPNLYGNDPSLQISPNRDTAVLDKQTETRIADLLANKGIAYKNIETMKQGVLVRFNDVNAQLTAKDLVSDDLGDGYTVALNLYPAAPAWLTALNAAPMYLGLDLRGGVHFLMEVDMNAAMRQSDDRYVGELRTLLRSNKVRYLTIARHKSGGVDVKFRDNTERAKALLLIGKELPRLVREEEDRNNAFYLRVTLSEQEARETKEFALQQNITTLRNRVNELGVAEPIIQRQGLDRIIVQLPGIQDTARAKDILGATATLEYRMADSEHDVEQALQGRVPAGSRLYYERNGSPILLKKDIIITGANIVDAASGIDQQSGSPMVHVTLDSKGAKKMARNTRENVGKPMAVVFIENKVETRKVNGELVKTSRKIEEVISVANIREEFSKRFQTTGLDSFEEARDLALLLRAGALSTPIEIVEERTVGPSLGQDNIDMGFRSVVIGFIFVLLFMAVWYRVFGLVANIALALNLVLLVAVLSMLQATLTLPGIAGIVLTVGMAVDANVLIFERIREEIRNGNTPQASIAAGYDKAFSTIADANITTLIAALVLYGFGTGPIKGFAITLSIGILCSMFTAIVGTRAIINLVYGGRKLEKLAI